MSAFALGWALIDADGVPQVDTVGSTERKAQVNALVTVFGMSVFRTDSDAKIAKMTQDRLAECPGVTIGQVSVERMP